MKKNKSNIQESILVIFFGIIIFSIFSFWIYNYFTEDLIPNLNYSNSPEDNYIFNENNLGFPIDEFYQGGADVFLNDPEALFLIDAHVLNFTYDNKIILNQKNEGSQFRHRHNNTANSYIFTNSYRNSTFNSSFCHRICQC